MADIADYANDYAQMSIDNALRNRVPEKAVFYKVCRNCEEPTLTVLRSVIAIAEMILRKEISEVIMRYYTATEAGAYLREHPTNIRTKAAKGLIRGFKRGGKKSGWLFLKEDLDYYIQQNENTPRQEVQRHEELKTCQSNRSKSINVAKYGITRSVPQTALAEYAKVVGLATNKKH